jgi:hypothetical protein
MGEHRTMQALLGKMYVGERGEMGRIPTLSDQEIGQMGMAERLHRQRLRCDASDAIIFRLGEPCYQGLVTKESLGPGSHMASSHPKRRRKVCPNTGNKKRVLIAVSIEMGAELFSVGTNVQNK